VHYEAFRFSAPKKDADKLKQLLKVKEREKKQQTTEEHLQRDTYKD